MAVFQKPVEVRLHPSRVRRISKMVFQFRGLEFNITDTMHVRPVNFGIHLIQTITTLYPADIKERLYKTRAHPSGSQHLDKLLGLKNAFQKILRGEPIDTSCSEWKEIMKPFLLYG